MIAYKLTDQNMQTCNNTQWQIGEWKETDGEGDLCGSGWLHYYSDPLLATLLNPVHANFENPRLFEIEVTGKIKEDHGLKFGCTKMRLVKELQLPAVNAEQRIKFGILCALEVCADPAFIKWAKNWLNGTDRTAEAARAAEAAGAEYAVTEAAWAAAEAAGAEYAAKAAYAAAAYAAAYAAADAAKAAAKAAARAVYWAADAAGDAAEIKPLDLIAIAQKAVN